MLPEIPTPRYNDRSLADLTPSLLAALSVDGFPNVLGLEPARAACLLVVDGMGWEALTTHADAAPFLFGLTAESQPVTSVFPSTTPAALSSIGTGLPPGTHGVTGATIAVPGSETVLNAIRWTRYGPGQQPDACTEVVPERWQPYETVFERAASAGATVTKVAPGLQSDSGLTRAGLRGGDFRGQIGMGDLVTEVVASLRSGTGPPALVYAYHADLDAIGHVHGLGSEPWLLQLAHIDLLVRQLAERLPSGALLAVTADHGMVNLPLEGRIDLDDRPDLRTGVLRVAGEARVRHLYTARGAEGDVAAAWRAEVGERAWVLTRDEVIASGLFGPRVAPRVHPRIGDVVMIAWEAIGVVQRSVDPAQARFIGHHGSVTPEEQLVPLLLVRA